MLEFAILGLLHQTSMHGYELRKELAQVLGGLRSISYGSLYPALKRMHAAGLIATEDPDRHAMLPADAPPLTGRRGKVVYTITAEGKERFHELVGQTGPEAYDDGGLFGVRLAFSETLQYLSNLWFAPVYQPFYTPSGTQQLFTGHMLSPTWSYLQRDPVAVLSSRTEPGAYHVEFMYAPQGSTARPYSEASVTCVRAQ